ncbi:hypothetical protein L1278_001157 [Pontibacter sp. HSC-36F09]|nr:hypothetical protein [Pontibacter sp. HSC-36F09]
MHCLYVLTGKIFYEHTLLIPEKYRMPILSP